MDKINWVSPQLKRLDYDLIKSSQDSASAFAEYYDLVNCTVVYGQTAANAAAMAACSMNGVSGDSFTYIATCSVVNVTPSSWSPGNSLASSYGNGCCGGPSPWQNILGVPASAGLTAQASGQVACS